MRTSGTGLVLGLLLSCAAGAAVAAACKVESPAHRVALVELYTSQGCSSCPPADRWLSAFSQRYRSTEAIAMALHVGYWDYIGWKDPYAKPAFSDRHRQWAAANQHTTVYTPGVFIQGREVRDWRADAGVARQIRMAQAMPAGAQISVAGQLQGQVLQLDVSAQATLADPQAVLRVAVLQSGLSTAVGAGENHGARLVNDHVVREWSAALPLGRHRLTYNLPAGPMADGWAVVAFVQGGGGHEILQVVRWTPRSCQG